MDWWEDEFCMRLVAGGQFVVRYDHRDTGQSVSCEPGSPLPYTLDDLVADPAALIDCLDLQKLPTSSGCRWAAVSLRASHSATRVGSPR